MGNALEKSDLVIIFKCESSLSQKWTGTLFKKGILQ